MANTSDTDGLADRLKPRKQKKGSLLQVYKGRSSRMECRNYREITNLSVPGRVFGSGLESKLIWTRIYDLVMHVASGAVRSVPPVLL